MERSARMTWVDFLSSLGGLFGLCLGFSIISFIEVGLSFDSACFLILTFRWYTGQLSGPREMFSESLAMNPIGEISSEGYGDKWGVSKESNIILMTFLGVLRWWIVTFDKINYHRAYSISQTKLHLFQILSVTLTFLVSHLFLALKRDSPSVSAFQLQHLAW